MPYRERAQAVSDQNKRHRKRESERAQDTVDRERHVNRLEIEELADIGESTRRVEHSLLALFGLLFESVRNEEHRRPDNGAERDNRILFQCKPHDSRQEDRDGRIKPHALRIEESLSDKPELLLFHEEPVEKEKHQEDSAAHQEYRRRRFNCRANRLITGKRREKRIDRPEPGRCRPDNRPWQESAHHKDREKQSPSQEPSFRLLAHRTKNLRVDNGVVDTRHDFEQEKSEYDEND